MNTRSNTRSANANNESAGMDNSTERATRTRRARGVPNNEDARGNSNTNGRRQNRSFRHNPLSIVSSVPNNDVATGNNNNSSRRQTRSSRHNIVAIASNVPNNDVATSNSNTSRRRNTRSYPHNSVAIARRFPNNEVPTGNSHTSGRRHNGRNRALNNYNESASMGNSMERGTRTRLVRSVNNSNNEVASGNDNTSARRHNRGLPDDFVVFIMNYQQDFFNFVFGPRDSPPPLPDNDIRQISRVKINNDDVQRESRCTTCIEDFRLDETACKLPCGHMFHENCIVPWLRQRSTCPICRRSLLTH